MVVVVPLCYLLLLFPLSSREFAKEKDRVESRAGFLLLKEEQKLEREMNGYMNWICKAGKIRNPKNRQILAQTAALWVTLQKD